MEPGQSRDRAGNGAGDGTRTAPPGSVPWGTRGCERWGQVWGKDTGVPGQENVLSKEQRTRGAESPPCREETPVLSKQTGGFRFYLFPEITG